MACLKNHPRKCHYHINTQVTILCNKFDGHPKGFAYVEFTDKDSVSTAMALDESLFRGRQIKVSIGTWINLDLKIWFEFDVLCATYKMSFKVMPKRTNKPGISTTNRPPRFLFLQLKMCSYHLCLKGAAGAGPGVVVAEALEGVTWGDPEGGTGAGGLSTVPTRCSS